MRRDVRLDKEKQDRRAQVLRNEKCIIWDIWAKTEQHAYVLAAVRMSDDERSKQLERDRRVRMLPSSPTCAARIAYRKSSLSRRRWEAW